MSGTDFIISILWILITLAIIVFCIALAELVVDLIETRKSRIAASKKQRSQKLMQWLRFHGGLK